MSSRFLSRFIRTTLFGIALSTTLATSASATNLVLNGDFENNGGVGQISGGVSYATNWSIGTPQGGGDGFGFIVNANADSAGFPSVYTAGSGTNIFLWGPGYTPNPVSNGFTGSPNGGFFLGAAGGFAVAPISQTISGLTPGQTYTLSFTWAASQMTDFFGGTTQYWDVSFGGTTVSTDTANVANRGFVDWAPYTHDFTATSVTETLSFLAQGSPTGNGPFLLIDGITLSEAAAPVPEIDPASAGSVMMLLIGALGLLDSRVRRRRLA